jgi:hypothetical protein
VLVVASSAKGPTLRQRNGTVVAAAVAGTGLVVTLAVLATVAVLAPLAIPEGAPARTSCREGMEASGVTAAEPCVGVSIQWTHAKNAMLSNSSAANMSRTY